MLNLRTALALTTLGLSLGTLAACTVHNANHCALNEGACSGGMACSMCAIDNNGCVPAAAVDQQCLFLTSGVSDTQTTVVPTTTSQSTESTTDMPGTSETTVDPTFGSDTMVASATTVEDTTDGMTTGSGPCGTPGGLECGGDTPYCVKQECVGCQALSCPEVDPEKPACKADIGLCVECIQHADCTADDDKPACNPDTATCESCSSHDQCEATACNLEVGRCFPKDKVIFVDNTSDDGIKCDNGDANEGKTQEIPLCTLQEAMTRLNPNEWTTVKVKAGKKSQNLPSVVPAGDITVAIVRYGKNVPGLVVTSADPAIAVQPGNLVFMYDIAIFNDKNAILSDPLIDCSGGRLWLEQQRIITGRSAIFADNCQVHVRRSTITGHTVGAIDITGVSQSAKLWLENSYVTDNTGSTFGALRLGGKGSADILYSTIALNASPVAAIECSNGWGGTLTVRNSAIVDANDHFSPGCKMPKPTASYESSVGDKNQLGSVFAGFSSGVFQAKSNGALKDVAVWLEGDPRIDNDITPRPAIIDGPDYAGADRPGN